MLQKFLGNITLVLKRLQTPPSYFASLLEEITVNIP